MRTELLYTSKCATRFELLSVKRLSGAENMYINHLPQKESATDKNVDTKTCTLDKLVYRFVFLALN